MNDKKILMWMSESDLRPVGGPSGYLYSIFIELKKGNNSQNISFLPPYIKKPYFKRVFYTFLKERFKYLKYLSYKSFLLQKTILNTDYSINNYDIIHFHDTISLFKAREVIVNYKGKIVLTSHSPEPLHKELISNNYADLKENHKKNILYILELIDEYSFLRADYIMFPCKTAKEPYYSWPFFKNIININKKILYCPTGTSLVKPKKNKKFIRDKYGIKKSDFVISFVGRHNSIKGYDILKKIGVKILDKYPDVYFIIAGKESPIKGLDNERWIEVGFTKDPHSIISASDLFILPNRQTFFDLVLLEAMALGTMLLVSFTGGNKYFKKFNRINLDYLYNVDDAIEKIATIKRKRNSYNSNVNKNLFKQQFLTTTFISNYQNIINNIN